MKAGWTAVLVLAAALAGCAGEAANPNLAAPKAVLHLWPDGNVSLYVHSAFGERSYEWIRVSVDNQTLVNRTDAYSWEGVMPGHGFYLEVEARNGTALYELRARVDVDAGDGDALVATLDPDGEWSEPRKLSRPPFELFLQRRDA